MFAVRPCLLDSSRLISSSWQINTFGVPKSAAFATMTAYRQNTRNQKLRQFAFRRSLMAKSEVGAATHVIFSVTRTSSARVRLLSATWPYKL